TRLGYQRTMLSWVRTATALITFGFAVYNFHRIAVGDHPSGRLIGPHEFALIVVATGLVALLLAMIEYRRDVRALSTQYPDIRWSPLPGGVALLVSVLGLLAFDRDNFSTMKSNHYGATFLLTSCSMSPSSPRTRSIVRQCPSKNT